MLIYYSCRDFFTVSLHGYPNSWNAISLLLLLLLHSVTKIQASSHSISPSKAFICRCTCGLGAICTCVTADMVEVAEFLVEQEAALLEEGASVRESLVTRVSPYQFSVTTSASCRRTWLLQ